MSAHLKESKCLVLMVSSRTSGAMYLQPATKRAVAECHRRRLTSVRAGTPLGSNPLIGCNVDGVGGGVVTDSQSQVGDGTAAVLLHQDVLGLEVPVGNAGLSWGGHTARSGSFHKVTFSSCVSISFPQNKAICRKFPSPVLHSL